jgi:D-serine dehydratase
VVVVSVPNVAVIVSVSLAETLVSVAVKVFSVEPSGITIDAGSVSALSELERLTVVAALGTATLRSTVHVVLSPGVSVVGEQAMEDSMGVA